MGAAQIAERLDDAVASEEQVEAFAGAPVLANIPFDISAQSGLGSLRESAAALRVEALRTLRTSLRFIDVDHPPRCIVVTSCEPGVGKSVTSSTLAAVLADAGARVAVVEGDLRRPRLRQYMGVGAVPIGLADVLLERRDVLDAVRVVDTHFEAARDEAGDVALLASGVYVPNPSELLGSVRMREVIERLKESYDTVIIDAPPLTPVTDAAVLATLSDGVLMVVEYGQTSKRDLTKALGALDRVSARLLGIVANKTAMERGYDYSYIYPDQRISGTRLEEAEAITPPPEH
jgi:capsular exopolysaccharide synthesis family protein